MISASFTGSAQGIVLKPETSVIVDGVAGAVSTIESPDVLMLARLAAYQSYAATNPSLITDRPTDPAVPVSCGRVIRVSYPAQSCSPGSKYMGNTPQTSALAGVVRPVGGTMAAVKAFRRPAKRARMEYAVNVPAGFDFRMGGKLPGLSTVNTTASGGNQDTAGITSFTARFMWHTGGRVDSYFYNAQTKESATTFGVNFNNLPDVYLQTGWNRITQEIQLNDVGLSNGTCVCSLNGVQFLNRADIKWRDSESLLIEGAWFCTFFGGNTYIDGDNTWETLVDTYLDFSDIQASTL